jgi:flagellar basal body-associated protein FliL
MANGTPSPNMTNGTPNPNMAGTPSPTLITVILVTAVLMIVFLLFYSTPIGKTSVEAPPVDSGVKETTAPARIPEQAPK